MKRAHLKELNLYMNDIGDAGILKVILNGSLQKVPVSDVNVPAA